MQERLRGWEERRYPSHRAAFARMDSLLNSSESESSFFARSLAHVSNPPFKLFRRMQGRPDPPPDRVAEGLQIRVHAGP